MRVLFASFTILLLTACSGGSGAPQARTQTLPVQSPPSSTQFVDVTAASGIAYEIGYLQPPGDEMVESLATGGAAAGDFDGDGDIDLFIVRGDIGPNLLYANRGNLFFEDVAAQAGVAFTKSSTENYRHSGPTFADMDGDGDLDLFIGGLFGDPSLVLRNEGDTRFTDVTQGSGIDTLAADFNISAAFGDYDLDGDLDLFVAHWGTPRDFSHPADTEHLWRNDSDASGIRFTSVSEAAGISPSILTQPDALATRTNRDYSFTPTFARVDTDRYPDILSVADFNTTQFFSNNGNDTFSNATDTNVIVDDNGMGSAVGDYDNDGDLDWFVSSIFAYEDISGQTVSKIGNRLYRNDHGVFVDVADQAGVANGAWGWGACFVDFENDGDLDIYHTNGWSLPESIFGDFSNDTSRAFVADGNGSFEERAAELGLADSEEGRGIVCADFDADGDVDILQLHRAPELSATLWENTTSSNNYLRVKLMGLPPNTEAAGARIKARVGTVEQLREIMVGSNFLSQNPTLQVFGLGTSAQVDILVVEWPDGQETTRLNVLANQTLIIGQP